MSADQYEQIEEYLSGQMSSAERQAFESAMAGDQRLAQAFHLYSVIEKEMKDSGKYDEEMAALKKTLQSLGENYRSEGYKAEKSGPIRWIIAAAACLVIVVGIELLPGRGKNPQQLAGDYIKTTLTHISRTMGAGHGNDGLQTAIDAYNSGDYEKARPLLEGLAAKDTSNTDALEYLGRTSLLAKRYDEALLVFRQLADKKGLYSNPGKFLEAVTLLQRNNAGDAPQARQLLQEVVSEKGEGSKEAEQWLQRFQEIKPEP
jgi:tetratricopeptide (TPR) repeat protein